MSISVLTTPQIQQEHIQESFSNDSVGNGINVAEFDVAEIQGSRKNMEDTHITLDTSHPNIGDITLVGVYDGHNGVFAAEILRKYSSTILFDSLTEYASGPADEKGIITAFQMFQDEMQKKMPKFSGATVVLCLVLKENNTAFTLVLGDGSFSFSDKDSGEILEGEIRVIDTSLGTDNVIFSKMTPEIHQIQTLPVLKPEYSHIETEISEETFDQYYCPGNDGDIDERSWKEWKAWNMSNANTQKTLKFPTWTENAWRIGRDQIQPTRTLGNESTIHQGEIYIHHLPDLTQVRLLVYCDGISDNNAITNEQLAKLSADFSEANNMFLNDHLLTKIVKNVPLGTDSSLIEKINWVVYEINNTLANSVDEDWKRGVKQAGKFFSNPQNITQPANATQLAQLAVARLSGDNITLVSTTFK